MSCFSPDYSDFVEVDPSGRYGRYDEILGKGSSKTVYRAFDEYEGIEVAWNQVKLYDFLQRPEDLERLYCEIHLLKTLKHENIMKFYTSWVDTANRNINFVTEMFTSGTLRQYRQKHKRVNLRAIKHWCRQILKGLFYLHSHDPPVIHRDLKCDNIFINGHQGEVKIGDLGLAAILLRSHDARCVGTPEFMAPEVYAEEYNELVDIYSFGMCILEMVTFEYPYSECTHPAQIYKKVISGKKPDSLYKVKDPEVRQFVEKCLATASSRLSAKELLEDPFLQLDNYESDFRSINYCREPEVGQFLTEPLLISHHSSSALMNGHSNVGYETQNDWVYHHPVEFEPLEIALFNGQEDEHLGDLDISINGRREDGDIFLRLRIADKEGHVRNIYFHFDIGTDTALSVAAEMVAELDITDQDVTRIADMIDGAVASLVPEWKTGLGIEESPGYSDAIPCQNCALNGSLMNYISSNGQCAMNLQVLQCSHHGCAAVHGRFEEITYQFEGSEQCVTEGAPVTSSLSDGIQYTDIWGQHDGAEVNSQETREMISDDENYDRKHREKNKESVSDGRNCCSPNQSGDYENEIRQELRWLKARYQLQLRELKDQQIGVISSKSLNSPINSDKKDQENSFLKPMAIGEEKNESLVKSSASGKHFSACFPVHADEKCSQRRVPTYDAGYGSCSPGLMGTAKSFYAGTLLPLSLHRATSLPVDAVEF